MSGINIQNIKDSLKKEGWFLGREVGSGGGAKIFLCFKESLINSMKKFMEQSGPMIKETNSESICLNTIDSLYSGFLPSSLTVGAVKVPKALHEPSEIERLKREIQALKAIKHPNLIRLFAADEKDPSCWFIMEYHPNGTLQNHIDLYVGKPLETIKAVQGIAECLSSLHSHSSRYVHRDIKPKNIFVDFHNRLVLGDFGIVFPNEDDGDQLTIPGTSEIFSRDWIPDWVRFRQLESYGPKIDVYMLAKVIYFMISGGQNVPASQLTTPFFDLTKKFPESVGIGPLFEFLKRCITTQEEECEPKDGKELFSALNELAKEIEQKPRPQLIFNQFQSQSLAYIPIPSDGKSFTEIIETKVFLEKGLSLIRARAKVERNSDAITTEMRLKLNRRESTIVRITQPSWSEEMTLKFENPITESGWYDLSVEAFATLNRASLVAINIYGQ